MDPVVILDRICEEVRLLPIRTPQNRGNPNGNSWR